MNSNAIRMMVGYSRFVLQEERRHDLRTGVFVYHNLMHYPIANMPKITPFFRNYNSFQDVATGAQKSQIPNLVFQVSEHNNKITLVGHMTNERTENQTNTIQYQANNGIEDRLIATTLKSINAEIVCVFDGHGGDKLSDYCANNIVGLIDSFIQKNKNIENYVNDFDKLIIDSLKFSYEKIDQDFYENVYKNLVAMNNKKIRNVGTCALTIVICNKKIYVANCGDSEAIIVSKGKDSDVKYIELNERLSVNNPAERQRLRKEFPNDDDIVVEELNGCFYIKGRLQPSRALGDYHLKYGHLYKGKGTFNGPYIKGEPDIKIFPLQSNYKSIVVASDGVWDFMNKKQVAQSSLKPNPHENILQQTLSKIAKIHKKSVNEIRQIQAAEKRGFHDDISIAVISLGQGSEPKPIL